jgi:Ca2+:H+ antiporter
VAEHLGDTIGGLVNASFGNLMEMVIGVQALAQGEIRVVQASMLGSILSNLLLVTGRWMHTCIHTQARTNQPTNHHHNTGSCFLVGGLIHHEQRFNSVAGVANLSLLFLATMALVVPTPIGCVCMYMRVHV